LEAAVKELEALQAEKPSEESKAAVRVSQQEPEARLMKHGDNAIAPSYNAQISTEGKKQDHRGSAPEPVQQRRAELKTGTGESGAESGKEAG